MSVAVEKQVFALTEPKRRITLDELVEIGLGRSRVNVTVDLPDSHQVMMERQCVVLATSFVFDTGIAS